MKLRNKKTGEIIDIDLKSIKYPNTPQGIPEYKLHHSLAELNAEWEDAPEEQKEHWCITMYGGITRIKDDEEPIDDLIEIGNYFNSKEDAYDAWDKLKAWKRLKDKGFRFEGIKEDWSRLTTEQTPFHNGRRYLQFTKAEDEDWLKENWTDLHLLFGGEE